MRQAFDTVTTHAVKSGKEEIDGEIDTDNEGGKARPVECKHPMINVPPILLPRVNLNELELAGVNGNSVSFFPHGTNSLNTKEEL